MYELRKHESSGKRRKWSAKKRSRSSLPSLQHDSYDFGRFLLSHALLQTSQNHLRAALHTAQTHLLVSQSLLAHLESANVYNDAFQIGHVPLHPNDKGSITVGTINGLRLGGRPVVEWDEINAGWGLVGLCIDRVGVKVECTFEG